MKLKLITLALAMSLTVGCVPENTAAPTSKSGVGMATVQVKKGSDGLTTEQRNIAKKLIEDNKPGTIKHLYILSAYSGQAILYSPVKGKVTSSGKRLSPVSVVGTDGQYVSRNHKGIPVTIAGSQHHTTEVLQDDGTYGSSIPYLYWWDTKGIGHKHYVAGGQIVHISEQPLPITNITINVEAQ